MDEQLDEALRSLRAFVAGREPLADTLHVLAESATQALGAHMAGITLIHQDGRPRTAACTSSVAADLDQAQYEADRGPCLEAYRTKAVVTVDDAQVDDRWPEFASRAAQHGVRSSLSAPLVVRGEGIGALNLYSREAAHFHHDDADHAELYVAEAAVALANAEAYWQQATLAENLGKALESRSVIEQAKGVIIATAGVTPDEAFDLLRQQSQTENRKLRVVAAEIVERQYHKPPTITPGAAR
jgi:GAF domain-containing protein